MVVEVMVGLVMASSCMEVTWRWRAAAWWLVEMAGSCMEVSDGGVTAV